MLLLLYLEGMNPSIDGGRAPLAVPSISDQKDEEETDDPGSPVHASALQCPMADGARPKCYSHCTEKLSPLWLLVVWALL